MTVIKTNAETALAQQFALALPGLPGDANFAARRKAAFARFEAEGLPDRRIEAWHYTDLRNMMRDAALPILSVPPLEVALASKIVDPLQPNDQHIRFVNGAMMAPEGLPRGVEIINWRAAIAANHPLLKRMGEAVGDVDGPMVALNTAMFSDGIVLRVAKGVKLDKPLHASCILGADMSRALNVRTLIVVEEGASATFVDSMVGATEAASQSNSVIEILVDDGARAEFIRFNGTGKQSQAISLLAVSLGRNADFSTFCMTAGSHLSRHEVRVAARGAHSKISINGVNLLNGDQHADSTLEVDHIAPNCESRELYRSVVDGHATGVFQGKIMVKREAQKTDGRMASNAVLLSDDATMNNKPELEIFADDVQCAHGATCGALDEDLLFYLQARGLPKKEAEALMIQAFCGEAIETVSDERLRDALNAIVENWLKARAA